jgi:hypothetical protein
VSGRACAGTIIPLRVRIWPWYIDRRRFLFLFPDAELRELLCMEPTEHVTRAALPAPHDLFGLPSASLLLRPDRASTVGPGGHASAVK